MKKSIITLSILFLTSLSLFSETAEEKGLRIAKLVDEQDNGYKDSQAILKMTLVNKHGQTTSRKMRFKSLEVEGDGDRSQMIFDNPRDISGTAMLTFTHKKGPDDQWLYLPALKRVKRIASKNKSGPFMGSEFAYEDLASQEVEKYTYKYLRDEKINGFDCYVIDRDPVDPNSGYTHLETWINKEKLVPEKIVFYDRKNTLLKTLIFKDYKQYLGKFWRAESFEMVNHQKGKKTTLEWIDYKFRLGLTKKNFNKNSLKRAR